jgi:GNAT superfamily N-acetyltransferase
MGEIHVRTMQEEDIGSALAVLAAALGEPSGLERTHHLWSWKHIDNPFGRSIVFVAEAGGAVAGLRAFMRWELDTPDGTRLRCVRAVDTATHPDFHRRGIFQTLTEAAVDEARRQDVDLIFNTPNPRSGAGYLKMGWSEVGGIPVMVRPSWRLLRRRPQSGLHIDAPREPPVTATDRAPRGFRTPRNADYLEWRYGRHPSAIYRTIIDDDSAVVLRENERAGRRELVVSEMLGPDAGALLRRAARSARADYLVGSFQRGSPEWTAALLAGLIPVPRRRALTLFARPLREVPGATDLKRWDLSIGDLELL